MAKKASENGERENSEAHQQQWRGENGVKMAAAKYLEKASNSRRMKESS